MPGSIAASDAARARRAPARGGLRQLLAAEGQDGRGLLVAPALDRKADAHADPRAEGDREQVGAQQPPGSVDRERDDRHLRRRVEERLGAGRPEATQLAAARARALRVEDRGHAPLDDLLAEPADHLGREAAIAAVDDRVAPGAKIVRDARDPARELALRYVLREVGAQHRPVDRDVEHALVVADEQVGAARHEKRRALDLEPRAGEPERLDQTDL
jgi:hypothetical protein